MQDETLLHRQQVCPAEAAIAACGRQHTDRACFASSGKGQGMAQREGSDSATSRHWPRMADSSPSTLGQRSR